MENYHKCIVNMLLPNGKLPQVYSQYVDTKWKITTVLYNIKSTCNFASDNKILRFLCHLSTEHINDLLVSTLGFNWLMALVSQHLIGSSNFGSKLTVLKITTRKMLLHKRISFIRMVSLLCFSIINRT